MAGRYTPLTKTKVRHGSLFSGLGGCDLAAEWMGWENVFHCEWNSFGQKVLKHYWPNAISYNDITKSTFTIHRGSIDILTGGFPCQPFSTAGKRKGTDDNRYLWPEMLRVIREVQPSWIVGENVRGLVNWSEGLVFDTVCADLEAEGYEVFPVLLPAASVNAPHRRDRIWFIAKDTSLNGCILRESWKKGTKIWQQWDTCTRSSDGICLQKRDASDSNSTLLEYRYRKGTTGKRAESEKRIELFNSPRGWETFPTVSPICVRNDGLSDRLDGITFPKWRNESIKGAGNAIVPQVALQIFKTIEQYERILSELPS